MKFSVENTDSVILAELGDRLAQSRLARNLKQESLATAAGVSKRTIERLETGHSVQLVNFVRVLRALQLVEHLELLVPEARPSPIAQLKLRKKERHRASSPRASSSAAKSWSWGDDT